VKEIKTAEDVAGWFGVCRDEIGRLPKAVYKGTGCGAWISGRREGEEWDHDDNWWGKVEPGAPLAQLMIGSIVEGSDLSFDKTFDLPVEEGVLSEWMDELESLTSAEWERANYDWFYLKKGDDLLAVVKHTWDGVEVEWVEKGLNPTPLEEAAVAFVQGEGTITKHDVVSGAFTVNERSTFEHNGVEYVLEHFEPESGY
jgi:hypothetical protein